MEVFYEYNSAWDLILGPVYLFAIFFITHRITFANEQQSPYYRYFTTGLFTKIIGGILFTAIYTFYYPGGDCHAYYQGGKCLNNMILKAPDVYFSVLGGNTSDENWSYFDEVTGYPPQTLFARGGSNFATARYTSLILLFSFNSMIIGTILLCCLSYACIWKFYKMLCEIYPDIYKKLALGILFVPSLAFWGSGIMKDTYTYSSTLLLTASAYTIFFHKRKVLLNSFFVVISVFFIVTLKPYIIIALMPGLGLSIAYYYSKQIKNKVLGALVAPAFIVLGIAIGGATLSLLSSQLGTYATTEGIIAKAQINQQDLLRSESYGTNSFNIGQFDASIGGMLSKAPNAIIAGVFRPFLWDARNPVMVISGIENFLLLYLLLFLIFKLGLKTFSSYVTGDPIVTFAFIFVIIFGFSVGISTANFGALVRYKIPGTVFYTTGLMILWGRYTAFKKTESEKSLSTNTARK
jgi:hypothetical protein